MQLLTKALVTHLIEAGAVDEGATWKRTNTLGAWLAQYGGDETSEALTHYFAMPYRALPQEVRVTSVPLNEAPEWGLYYVPAQQWYCCTRPPKPAERAAFESHYPEAPLYLSDEVSVQSALLGGGFFGQTMATNSMQRIYELQGLTKQGLGHIDGVIGQILGDAIERGATDIHLYARRMDFCIDFRIDGALMPYAVIPGAQAEALLNKLKLMAEMDIAEHRMPQDGHIQLSMAGRIYHLRLGTLPLLDGEKIVMRILPEQQRLTSLSDLGFGDNQVDVLVALLHRGQGLLLITGPTNSGKTTSLYACLKLLAAEGKLVYTIEDPIEAVLPQVQQSQVNVKSGYSFAEGLRGMLRSDPDVLVVGELRDAETVDIAARAALSGHLVVATLHAFDAHQAVNRLRDLGISDLLLSAVLLAVVNQRLVARPCAACGGRGVASDGSCCLSCLGSGSDGRMGVQEMWLPNDSEREAIERGVSGVALRRQALLAGYHSIEKIAADKGVSL